MYQGFLYLGDSSNKDSNHYAFPLPVSPVVDIADRKVARIEMMPTGKGLETDTFRLPRSSPSDYTPEHQNLRNDLKPLNVVQPEGASFKVSQVGETGQVIEWQKWCFRVGFNQREGMVLYDVSFDCSLLMFPTLIVYRFAMLAEASSTGFPYQR